MKEEGFTLLELLVVCLVLALVAALSVPVVRVTERMRLEREAALLASDFRYLQEVSRTERTADGKGEWRLRPKLVVEAHRYYFLLPWAAGEVDAFLSRRRLRRAERFECAVCGDVFV